MGKMKVGMQLLLLMMGSLSGVNSHASSAVDSLLISYQQQGAGVVDTNEGRDLWFSKHGDRSCSSCHSDSLSQNGKHIKTGKLIKPMALSVNPERYRDGKKIEKWFRRNCKWTLGRECSAQEKANILSWLRTQ